MEKKKILFVCTHNANRSQIAEGLMRHLYGDSFEVYSAGSAPSVVNPRSLAALQELGIDTAGQRSKTFTGLMHIPFDFVITLCNDGEKTCPFFPGAKKYMHVPFDDPSLKKGSEAEIVAEYRRVRDEISAWLKDTFDGPQKTR